MNNIIFGIDIGGTTLKCGYFNTLGELIGKDEIPTRKDETGELIFKDITAYIESVLDKLGLTAQAVAGIGLGVPGSVDDKGVVNKCVNLSWGVVDVPARLSEVSGYPRSIILAANDANVAALGEYWKGGGAGYSSLMMFTIGTGVGGGLVIDGRIINGYNGAAAELGHMALVEGLTTKCGCGKSGCLEQVASASGIAAAAGKSNAKEVFDAAMAGDEAMDKLIDNVSMYLGKAMAIVSAVVDPECFIVGGGVSAAGDYLFDKIRKHYSHYVFHPSKDTKIVAATLGNDAGMYGAAKLVIG